MQPGKLAGEPVFSPEGAPRPQAGPRDIVTARSEQTEFAWQAGFQTADPGRPGVCRRRRPKVGGERKRERGTEREREREREREKERNKERERRRKKRRGERGPDLTVSEAGAGNIEAVLAECGAAAHGSRKVQHKAQERSKSWRHWLDFKGMSRGIQAGSQRHFQGYYLSQNRKS